MMNLFSRSKAEKTVYSELRTDMHSHLLPGIDDGAPDMPTSIELIKGFMDLGFRKLITTPHIIYDIYPNTREIILEKLAEVKAALVQEGFDVELQAAAEYFMDEYFKELLFQKEPLLTIKDNLVLVEFSLAGPPLDLKEMFFEMQMQGYQPVIAHPERYIFAENNKRFFSDLKDAGNFFQLNLLSLGGFNGRLVTELALYLLKNDFYNLVGSDVHNDRQLEALNHPSISSHLDKLLNSGKILNPQL